MPACVKCKKTGISWNALIEGFCSDCYYEKNNPDYVAKDAERKASRDPFSRTITMTTETTTTEDVERLGIVVGEAVMGMHIGRDLLAGFRDVMGGRSKAVERTLAEARREAMEAIKREARSLGADGIIAVDIKYHSISTGSAVNMPIVAVTGTAVRKVD